MVGSVASFELVCKLISVSLRVFVANNNFHSSLFKQKGIYYEAQGWWGNFQEGQVTKLVCYTTTWDSSRGNSLLLLSLLLGISNTRDWTLRNLCCYHHRRLQVSLGHSVLTTIFQVSGFSDFISLVDVGSPAETLLQGRLWNLPGSNLYREMCPKEVGMSLTSAWLLSS